VNTRALVVVETWDEAGHRGTGTYRETVGKSVLIGLRETVFLVLSTRSFTLRRSVIRWLLVKPQPLAYK